MTGVQTCALPICHPIYYGDAANPLFLRRCGIDEALGVIVTLDTAVVDDVVRAVRARRPDVMIVARAHDAQHARHLYTLRVTDTVPETIEASLQLSEAALVELGIAVGPVIASIHEKRDEIRHALQKAAEEAGRDKIHSVTPKSFRIRKRAKPS